MPTAIRVIFALLGSTVALACLWLRWMNARAQLWPWTQGRIIESVLAIDPGDGESSVRILYEYHVSGQRYTSRRIAFAASPNNASAKQQLAASFPAGAEVSVYYNPVRPRTSVLTREPSSLWAWGAATGLVFVAISTLAP